MEWVETTGKTLEEAKEAALDQLGVDLKDAEFDVLSDAKPGLFGRMRSEARVRARVRPTQPRPKEERRPRRRSTSRSGSDRGTNGEHTTSEGETMDQDVALAEQGEVAGSFVSGLLDQLDLDGEVAVSEVDEDTVEVAVSGGDLGMLIGPKGATLAALQEITRTVVQRRTGARNGWIVVDVSGYRRKRREALERFTREVAEEVRSTSTRQALEPMTAADRKLVHDTVNGIDGVTTTSEGEDPRRHVVILPD